MRAFLLLVQLRLWFMKDFVAVTKLIELDSFLLYSNYKISPNGSVSVLRVDGSGHAAICGS